MLGDIAAPVPGGVRRWPATVIVDKAYSRPSTRDTLRCMRITTVIPQRGDQIAQRASR